MIRRAREKEKGKLGITDLLNPTAYTYIIKMPEILHTVTTRRVQIKQLRYHKHLYQITDSKSNAYTYTYIYSRSMKNSGEGK